MVEFVTLNGTAVRVSSFDHRPVAELDGLVRHRVSLVVVVRGAPAHHAFLGLLASDPLRVAIPDGPSFAATLVRHDHATAGAGEAAVHRHELVLRETPPAVE